ncbi:hypothetical protein QJQ45_006633 [Haematococcus lacustris]|nr:hypothetical protein QJQ45_006633 [Haematococcus lacustris]
MTERNMQHQAAVHGGASATYGYSPAGQAPPPATRLLDLPPALLDDIACRVMQLGARSLLPLTCRAFSQAHLLHVPALLIQLGRQCCDQLLTPRVVAALQARTSKLALTLWQPETVDSKCYTDLLAHALAKLENCAAVEVCRLVSLGKYHPDQHRHLHCSPGLAQQLLDSFPSLTALTLRRLCVSSNALASLLSHPPLALQLQQLDIARTLCQDRDEPGAVGTLFQGLQLKQLSIEGIYQEQPGRITEPLLPSFLPLAQHLTQLHLKYYEDNEGFRFLAEYLQPLAQLQVLTITHIEQLEGLAELLQALPHLHTLQLPDTAVWGQQQLDTLLAATQITSLQLCEIGELDTSYADAPCSWQRLELTETNQWTAIAYLPLHSLSQPLVLGHLVICVEDIPDPELAAEIHRLAHACKVAMQVTELMLYMRREDDDDDDDDDDVDEEEEEEEKEEEEDARGGPGPSLQQERVDLAQLVALLQSMQCCFIGKVKVHGLHEITAADVVALAPLCRYCTHFELEDGSMEPSLGFWYQLVQLMPAVQKVTFMRVGGCVSAAMHESLQLMAEQPWARWLDITIHDDITDSELPSCWQTGSWVKDNIFKVSLTDE